MASQDSSVPRLLHIEEGSVLQEIKIMAIGGDGASNQFLMSKSTSSIGHIWKWCHEYPVRFDGVANEGLTLISRSFSEFLTRVADDWQRFIANDGSWQYLAG